MKEIVIASAVRTAIGNFGGALAGLSATELGVIAAKEAIKSGLPVFIRAPWCTTKWQKCSQLCKHIPRCIQKRDFRNTLAPVLLGIPSGFAECRELQPSSVGSQTV
jgi:hypothetical protein